MILLRADSCAFAGGGALGESGLTSESDDSCAGIEEGGDRGGASWKRSSGSRSTRRVTQLTTFAGCQGTGKGHELNIYSLSQTLPSNYDLTIGSL